VMSVWGLVSLCVLALASSLPLPLQRRDIRDVLSADSQLDGDAIDNAVMRNAYPIDGRDTPIAEEPTYVDFDAVQQPDSVRFVSTPNLSLDLKTMPERNMSDDPTLGCLELPFALCVGTPDTGGSSHIAGDSLSKSLVGWWTFDDAMATDQSGRLNSIVPIPDVGPGLHGYGSSAYFNGSYVSLIPHLPPYASDEVSWAFWMFLIEEPATGFRTILNKGTKTSGVVISMWPETRRLKIRVSLSPTRSQAFDSVSSIAARRWSHVALVLQLDVARLYINGILDSKLILNDAPQSNQEPIFVANDPWQLGIAMFMDDFRIYSRRLRDEEVSMIAGTCFPEYGTDFVRLGCTGCKIVEAFHSCDEFHHVCTRDELESGVLTVARLMGWIDLDMRPFVWTMESQDTSGQVGLTFCCRNF